MPTSTERVVLITGTSSGIGLAAAIAFAAAGDTVVATMAGSWPTSPANRSPP
jgi:NAD(P)-dependent dehydrogenase (short-subunit alcohol dehydrogenase family)